MDLQTAFDSCSRVLFGMEIGKLSEFEEYFSEMMMPCLEKKSSVSGKKVMLSIPYYPEGAKFVSQDEVEKLKFAPLNVNQIKDIDSLFEAVQERTVYCGNKLFGKNVNVKNVDNCVNCIEVINSNLVYNVKYGAYLSCVREAEYVFGLAPHPRVRFAMRSQEGYDVARAFESHYCANTADTYYAFNCIACQNCIFAFNLRGKRNVIGNLELPKEKYLELKKKLVLEMGEELKRKKRLFSIADIAFFGREKKKEAQEKRDYASPVPPKVEEAFRSTCRIVLSQEHQDIKRFSEWLSRNTIKIRKVKGAFGSPTYKMDGFPILREIPSDRLVTLGEGEECAKKRIEIREGEELSLQEMLKRVSKCAYFCVEFVDGQNQNCVDTPSVFGGSNIYHCWDTTRSKNSAYSTGVIESEYVFGGSLRVLQSKFCINCYDSTSLSNCFEVDNSYSCRNCLFCHDCENIQDGIFCFNTKGKRYAIGNTEVGKEEFLRVKKILLEYLNGELGEKGGVKEGIFGIRGKS